MAYDVKKSVVKGGVGAVDGLIASAVAALVIGFVKSHVGDLDENTQDTISSSVAVVVAAAVVAIKKFVENWMKHKDSKDPVTPVPPSTPQPQG